MHIRSLGQEYPLEKKTETHSSILAWETPLTEKPSGLYSPWRSQKELDMTQQLNNNKCIVSTCTSHYKQFIRRYVNTILDFHRALAISIKNHISGLRGKKIIKLSLKNFSTIKRMSSGNQTYFTESFTAHLLMRQYIMQVRSHSLLQWQCIFLAERKYR